eukprot:4542096-Amphidinium_carterae.1
MQGGLDTHKHQRLSGAGLQKAGFAVRLRDWYWIVGAKRSIKCFQQRCISRIIARELGQSKEAEFSLTYIAGAFHECDAIAV